MLHLIERALPAFAHRRALRIAHALRLRWWRLTRAQLTGCRVVALDGQSRVLLIRHSYGHDRWMLPGGGMKRGEDPILAGTRELAEETGCTLHGARIATVIDLGNFGVRNRVHVIVGRAGGTLRADGREITHAGFFALDALPDHRVRGLAEGLAQWIGQASEPPRGEGNHPPG